MSVFNDFPPEEKIDDEKTWLNTEQFEALVTAIGRGSPEQGFTEGELKRLIRWTEQVLIDHSILEGILKGYFSARWNGEEFVFQLTPAGEEMRA